MALVKIQTSFIAKIPDIGSLGLCMCCEKYSGTGKHHHELSYPQNPFPSHPLQF
jgi:hypothetical protein